MQSKEGSVFYNAMEGNKCQTYVDTVITLWTPRVMCPRKTLQKIPNKNKYLLSTVKGLFLTLCVM